jgi:FkbM family methyltransferase
MRTIKDYYWPDNDLRTPEIVLGESLRIPLYLKFVSKFTTCIQAGGNVGVYSNILANHFEKVITVEPDPENYACLDLNVTNSKIEKINGALGCTTGTVSTYRPISEKCNYGATQVRITDTGIKIFKIDEFNLSSLDFLMLDVEGWEQDALQGGRETILKYKPTISLELKGLGRSRGYPDDYTIKWLEDLCGYKVKSRIGRDVVFTL